MRAAISGSPTMPKAGPAIQFGQRVERVRAAGLAVDAGRIGEVQDRIAGRAEQHAVVGGGQKAAAPVGRAAAWALLAGAEDDEARQVARLTPQAVGRPGAEARSAELLRAGVHENLRRRVVKRVGRHRLDNGDVIGAAGQVRQQFGQLDTAVAVAGEPELRAQAGRVGPDERRTVALEQLGRRQPAVVACQGRLVVEQLQMAGAAGHEQEDHVGRLRREVRPPGRHRLAGGGVPLGSCAGAVVQELRCKAIVPRPTPHCLKNQRRVSCS